MLHVFQRRQGGGVGAVPYEIDTLEGEGATCAMEMRPDGPTHSERSDSVRSFEECPYV
jgi:hypothetical protein